jgi:TPR repeat protein
MYYNGRGVIQDYKEAVKWYRLAAAKVLTIHS